MKIAIEGQFKISAHYKNLVTFLFILILQACQPSGSGNEAAAPVEPREPPDELIAGETGYNTQCALCHGNRATGTDKGPSLVQKVYEPNHHSDVSFQRAVQMGVRAHHFRFGDMPPVQGIETEEVGLIIAYVRWLQREAGIF